MPDIPYTLVTGKIPPLLSKIKGGGVPSSVDMKWLKQIGFTSSNDRSLVSLLTALGFVSAKQPTERWKSFRGREGKKVLGEAIREAYKLFYDIYPDAHLHPNSDLEYVVAQNSSGGARVISATVSTFKALVGEAEFDGPANASVDLADVNSDLASNKENGAPPQSLQPTYRNEAGPNLHVDVQVHIASDATAEQIEAVFSSMAKHLYRNA